MGNVGKKALGCLIVFGVLGVFSSQTALATGSETPSYTGKKRAFMGNPAHKRGTELGFDRGYWAAKSDQKFGREPDVSRHEAYHDPNTYYRYEFGNRGAFYQGFRAGFWAGYKYIIGKDATFKSPRKLGKSYQNIDWAGSSTGAGMGAEGDYVSRPKPKKKKSDISSVVISDAL
ncbi:MAG: hypothetical protein R3257_02675 [bacterium]|nr:hypothetical protein [bacterium]